MACRSALIVFVAQALGHIVVIEQPTSSLLRFHPRMQEAITHVTLYRVNLYLGHYMADSAKPLTLLTNAAWLAGEILERRVRHWFPPSSDVTRRTVDEYGVRRATGDQGLKATQTYPLAFGRAVAAAYALHAPTHKASVVRLLAESQADVDLDWLWAPSPDLWADAMLAPVFVILRELRERRV